MSELKSCPFCGEMPRIIEHEYSGASNTYGVRCRCGAQSFQFYEEPSLAANAWNARKGVPSADVEPVVRCKDCVHRNGDYCHNDDGFAHFDHFFVQMDDYCSRGARMDEQDA